MGEKTQDPGKEGQDTRTDEEIIAEKLRAAGMDQDGGKGGGDGGDGGGKEGYSDDGGGKGEGGDYPPKG